MNNMMQYDIDISFIWIGFGHGKSFYTMQELLIVVQVNHKEKLFLDEPIQSLISITIINQMKSIHNVQLQ